MGAFKYLLQSALTRVPCFLEHAQLCVSSPHQTPQLLVPEVLWTNGLDLLLTGPALTFYAVLILPHSQLENAVFLDFCFRCESSTASNFPTSLTSLTPMHPSPSTPSNTASQATFFFFSRDVNYWIQGKRLLYKRGGGDQRKNKK